MSTNPPSIKPSDDAEDIRTLPTFEEMDQMSHEDLAEALSQLAETVITNPLEYKLTYGLQTLDPKMLDEVDVSTPEGRKKLAALLKMLARMVMRSKEQYLGTVKETGKDQSRGR
ncbi:MAG: hypothetical protein J0M34_00980 [Alphaproteobacteria bacterium]|nr:hypothetical protein [Alphaproteobacteria bacterium]